MKIEEKRQILRPRMVIPPGYATAPLPRRAAAWLIDVAFFTVTLSLGWLFWTTRLWKQSTTPGKRAMGLMVYSTDSRAPATRRQMAERALVHRTWARLFAVGSLGIGFLWETAGVLGPNRRTAWDEWSRTLVVERPATETPAEPAAV